MTLDIAKTLIENCGKFDGKNRFADLPDYPQYESEVADWLVKTVANGETMPEILSTVMRFQPAESENNGAAMVALWPDSNARLLGEKKRLRGKPGKMFRRMFPFMTDSQIADLVDEYRERCFRANGISLIIDDSAESFTRAYSGTQAPMANPATTSYRKSLGNSCMRYSFDQLGGIHPCAAYASGDFQIYMVTDSGGLIHGRCVVRKACEETDNRPHAAPIYGVSESAIDLIQMALESANAVMAESANWGGARLVVNEYDRGGYIAPYLDLRPQSLSHNGKWLVVDSYGDIDASHYGGVLDDGNSCPCHECGERLDRDESCCDDYGRDYCECCYHDLFGYCEECEESVSRDDLNIVYRVPRYRYAESELTVCDCCRGNSYTQTDSGDYWHDDDVIHADNGAVISPDEFESDYFVSDWDGEIYHDDDMAETDDGERVGIEEINDLPDWQLNSDGIWTQAMGDLFDDDETETESDWVAVEPCPLNPVPDLRGLPAPEARPVANGATCGAYEFRPCISRGLLCPLRSHAIRENQIRETMDSAIDSYIAAQ